MIEKMTKYSFILLNEQTAGFLSRLQELGVMDITRSAKPVDETSSGLLEWLKECSKTIASLKKVNYSKAPEFDAIKAAYSEVPAPSDPIAFYKEQQESLAALTGDINSVMAEIRARNPWGEFDSSSIEKLKGLGYGLHYYKVSEKKYDPQWENEYAIQVVERDGKDVWFVVVAPLEEEYSFPAAETAAPSGSVTEALKELDELEKEQIRVKGHIMRAAESVPALEREYKAKSAELDLYLAGAASENAAEDKLNVFVGFAPASQEAEIRQELDSMGIFYMAEDAEEDDNPPIKLKNNRFSNLFEVLTGMYGMPVYGEFDPTPVLSIFFLLFFGMCMGDAGYGLILILFGIAESRKWIKIDMFKGLGPLITVLGAGTLLIGMVLGTAFGINLYEAAWYPEALKKIIIPDSVRIAGFSAQMVLALGIGVFHICLAMVIKAVLYTRRFGFRKTISVWGWLVLILGGIIVAAGAMTELLPEAAVKLAVIIIGVISALGIFIFNTPGRNPLVNIGAGLWDTYNMATGLLGDVLSYIRLYALGLAGGMLGSAFNTLGNMILGTPGDATWQWLPFVIIVLLGHTLNLLMSCLGAFVHPLRLTFVEYFKNSGYEGKGTLYRPLK
ncbi:MAG: ATPase V [Bacteroidales bacterium]|nr:ATPase V [Bacteroidales bacterium]